MRKVAGTVAMVGWVRPELIASSGRLPAQVQTSEGGDMKNNYEAAEGFSVSSVDSFVLGSKLIAISECDAIYGWDYSFMPWFLDIDENDD